MEISRKTLCFACPDGEMKWFAPNGIFPLHTKLVCQKCDSESRVYLHDPVAGNIEYINRFKIND